MPKIKRSPQPDAVQRFFYWIRERHSIHLRKEAGEPKPWTDDEVLQTQFFTNPYRENDKVTRWFHENIRRHVADDPMRATMATIIFRWFNLPSTAEVLMKGKAEFGLLEQWRGATARDRLIKVRESGKAVFTGAYIITGYGMENGKVEGVCDAITTVWKDRKSLVADIVDANSLEYTVNRLSVYPYIGRFMSYEVACDLRYTSVLRDATDICTWANPGPGARRGLNRLYGRDKDTRRSVDDCNDEMRYLYELSKDVVGDLPPLEMRGIEHSLCEFDKYERVRLNDGRSKRRYPGRPGDKDRRK